MSQNYETNIIPIQEHTMNSFLRLRFSFKTILIAAVLISMLPVSKVQADGIIITVTTYADELNNNGLCSLREAIINANANAQTRADCGAGLGEDGIVFIPSLEGSGTITLVSALPNISDTAGLTIDGEGRMAINGAGFYRAFYVNELASLSLMNIVITNTYHSQEGGAIYNAGDLFIFNSTFSNNVANFQGGAIYQNSAVGSSFYIENSTFRNNFAGLLGGAITIAGGEAQIHSTSFLDNKTDLSHGDGGAIYVAGGTLKTNKRTFHHNQSRYGSAIHTSGNTILINSTITGNIAWNGGGIFASTGNLIISNTTISNNTSIGVLIAGNAHVFLYNTIIANGINGSDCSNGSIHSIIGNNNLIENDMPGGFACDLGNGSMVNNILDVDPNLGSLVFTPTYYYPLNSGSPAIDSGSGCEVIDQRGVTRPQGAACDIGAYEYIDESSSPHVISITRASTNPTSAANVNFTVTFSEDVTGVNADGSDFELFVAGILGASIIEVTPVSASVYTISVNTGSGDGTIRLDVPITASISDLSSNALSGLPFTTGEVYSIDKSGGPLPSSPTFSDVPMNHPYWADIEILYANGYTAGCSTTSLIFCPDVTMNRAQSAVFMVRGNFGNAYTPPPAPWTTFGDDFSPGPWAQPWAQGMFNAGLTAGCSSDPRLFCPWEEMPRLQAAVFGLRLMFGNSYPPPAATGTVFADVNGSEWYAGWVEQAYANGLLPACGSSAGKPLFCPNDLVSRGLAAYMIVRAKNLSMP
ncbi:MAG: CSLREA domain-containing protein [Flavobacteriales bacterium]|nr:CSLREA domain-containing protein [Flavobacteriales bacterium]